MRAPTAPCRPAGVSPSARACEDAQPQQDESRSGLLTLSVSVVCTTLTAGGCFSTSSPNSSSSPRNSCLSLKSFSDLRPRLKCWENVKERLNELVHHNIQPAGIIPHVPWSETKKDLGWTALDGDKDGDGVNEEIIAGSDSNEEASNTNRQPEVLAPSGQAQVQRVVSPSELSPTEQATEQASALTEEVASNGVQDKVSAVMGLFPLEGIDGTLEPKVTCTRTVLNGPPITYKQDFSKPSERKAVLSIPCTNRKLNEVIKESFDTEGVNKSFKVSEQKLRASHGDKLRLGTKSDIANFYSDQHTIKEVQLDLVHRRVSLIPKKGDKPSEYDVKTDEELVQILKKLSAAIPDLEEKQREKKEKKAKKEKKWLGKRVKKVKEALRGKQGGAHTKNDQRGGESGGSIEAA